MLKLSENTLQKITQNDAEIDYLKSYVFDLKRHLKKTQKRTGMTRAEISAFIAIKMGQAKPSKGYLDRLTSFERFQKQGDIYQFQHESIIKHMDSLIPQG